VNHLTVQQLSAALDGALTGPSLELVVHHLANCHECRDRQARLARYDDALRRLLAVDPHDFFLDDLTRRAEAIVLAVVRGLPAPPMVTSQPLLHEEDPFEPAEPPLPARPELGRAGALAKEAGYGRIGVRPTASTQAPESDPEQARRLLEALERGRTEEPEAPPPAEPTPAPALDGPVFEMPEWLQDHRSRPGSAPAEHSPQAIAPLEGLLATPAEGVGAVPDPGVEPSGTDATHEASPPREPEDPREVPELQPLLERIPDAVAAASPPPAPPTAATERALEDDPLLAAFDAEFAKIVAEQSATNDPTRGAAWSGREPERAPPWSAGPDPAEPAPPAFDEDDEDDDGFAPAPVPAPVRAPARTATPPRPRPRVHRRVRVRPRASRTPLVFAVSSVAGLVVLMLVLQFLPAAPRDGSMTAQGFRLPHVEFVRHDSTETAPTGRDLRTVQNAAAQAPVEVPVPTDDLDSAPWPAGADSLDAPTDSLETDLGR